MSESESKSVLHGRVQGRVQEQLAQSLHNLFDELDVRLFDLAERNRVSSQQHLYFDGLRQLRLSRVDVETSFLRAAADGLEPKPEEPATRNGPLELLDKGEQEETLHLEGQIQRLGKRLEPSLKNLLARLCELTGQPPVEDPLSSVIAPRGLSRAFRTAMSPIDVNIEIRLIASGLFDQHVLNSLDALYSELNQLLADAGVLPDLPEPEAQLRTHALAHIRRNAPRKLPEAETDQAVEASEPGSQPDGNDRHLEELHHLVQARKQFLSSAGQSQLSGGAEPGTPTLNTNELDAALDQLWTYDGRPMEFKAQLINSARELAKQDDARLEPDDEDIVDLIGLLFSQIGSDPELPKPLQGMLSRLHIPFLRTALKDPSLLRGASHPGRELIDELGELAIGWCPSGDSDNSVLKLIALTVEQLASHFQNDRPIQFGQALKTLRQQLDSSRHRADLAEQRAIEVAIGRERLNLARTRVATLLERRFEQHDPMPWVRQLLRGPWSHHLVLVWLRNNENSAAFREAEGFVDELLWADDPNASSTDPARMRRARQTLPKHLRQGLSGVTLHGSDIESLISRLDSFLEAQMHSSDPPDFLYENDPTLSQTDFAAQWSELALDEQPAPDDIDQEMLTKLRSLPAGTWFEFRKTGEDEDAERAKLCWTSPYTGHNLFVNRNGQKVSQLSVATLAADMESGLARLIDSNRLLERSLRTMIEQLRETLESKTQAM